MADMGLLAGLAQGLESGVKGYQTERKYQDEKAQAEAEKMMRRQMFMSQLLEKGQTERAGLLELTPEQKRRNAIDEATKQASLAKAGYLAKYNEETGVADLEKIPGFKDIDDEYKKAMIRFTNARAGAALNPPPKEEKPLTDAQSNAAIFGRRIEKAEKDLRSLYEKGFNAADVKNRLSSMGPGFLQNENVKLQDQAERNFLAAVLRKESGSAISDKEMAGGAVQYFPRAGDTPAVLAQKAANRKQVLVGLRAAAGPGWERVPLVENEELPSVAASKKNGLVSAETSAAPTAPATKTSKDGTVYFKSADGLWYPKRKE